MRDFKMDGISYKYSEDTEVMDKCNIVCKACLDDGKDIVLYHNPVSKNNYYTVDMPMIENNKMSEVTSSSWNKLFEIETETEGKGYADLAEEILKYTDCYENTAVAEKLLRSEFVTVCTDGIIVWCDGRID